MSKNLNLKDTLFELPSKGRYDLGAPLINQSFIKIRPLLKGDQKVISAPGSTPYQVMYSLLDRVVTEPKIDLNKLLLSDAVAILFAVRLMSFGSQYKLKYQCENCNEFNTVAVDLNKIEVKYADDLEDFEVSDREVTLADGTAIKFHLPTLGDEKMISAQVKNLSKRGNVSNPNYNQQLVRLTQLCDVVSSIDTAVSPQPFPMRMKFFDEDLTMADEKKIWKAIYDADVGLIPETEHACLSCGYENSIMLNIDANFFRTADDE